MPSATPEDDIRGIGAALYALLVDRWPLPEAGEPSGLQPAEMDPAGEAMEPRAIDRGIPFQISAAAARSVQVGGGIRSAPTLLNLLQQATALADRTEIIEPPGAAERPAHPQADEEQAGAQARRRNVLIGVGIGAAILVVALIVLASVLKGIFGDVGGGLKSEQLGLNPSTSTENSSTPAGVAVKPVRATVFSPDGGPDNPDQADQAIKGGPGSGWSTDTYTDAVPFPNFKNGVGLMLQLPQPTSVGSVTLTVPSTGTQVQIRSATTQNPATIEDTTALTPPTTLKPGANTIDVSGAAPTSNLLVWISTMGTTDGENRTEISGLTVKAAS